MSIYELPTDILLTIARMNADAWVKLVSSYPYSTPNEFIKYSHSKLGIDEVASLATNKKNNNGYTTITVLGRIHSIGGEPAHIDHSFFAGSLSWYYNGELHRLDGPAVKSNYYFKYYRHGKMHRVDGPARRGVLGIDEYWIDGRQYSMPMPKSWQDIYLMTTR